MDNFLFFITLIVTLLLLSFLSPLFIKISKFLVRGILYSFLTFLLNFITGSFGFTAGVNLVTSLMCGIFGIYGMIFNYVVKMMYI